MSILKRLPESEIARFTHYGLFCGCVPVYFRADGDEGCELAVRNWWPDFLLPLAESLYGAVCFLGTLVNPDLEPMWPIRIQGEIYWPDDEAEA